MHVPGTQPASPRRAHECFRRGDVKMLTRVCVSFGLGWEKVLPTTVRQISTQEPAGTLKNHQQADLYPYHFPLFWQEQDRCFLHFLSTRRPGKKKGQRKRYDTGKSCGTWLFSKTINSLSPELAQNGGTLFVDTCETSLTIEQYILSSRERHHG